MSVDRSKIEKRTEETVANLEQTPNWPKNSNDEDRKRIRDYLRRVKDISKSLPDDFYKDYKDKNECLDEIYRRA